MKIDSLELQRLAAAQPRLDMYTSIHKALRACMAETLVALGRADTADDAQTQSAAQRVTDLLGLCEAHLDKENKFVHAAMEARAPGSSDALAHEHVEHEAHIAQLREGAAALHDAPVSTRPLAAQRLYQALALFVADNFRHMHVEETAHNAVLWAHYSDAELAAIHDELVASIPPQELMAALRWMVPSFNAAERLGFLADVQAKAPAPAFDAILQVARAHLDDSDWHQLCTGLRLLAVPGLVQA
jgi:hypothetical protein